MSDARVEAAAKVLADMAPNEPWPSNAMLGGGLTGTRDDEYRDMYMDQAREALEAADAVTPVLSKDVQVEKIATVLSQADGWLSLAHPSPRHQALLRQRALLIYEALIET